MTFVAIPSRRITYEEKNATITFIFLLTRLRRGLCQLLLVLDFGLFAAILSSE
jgi:hypothetical protein